MAGRLPPNMFKAGDVLKASDLQALVDAVRRQYSLPTAFQNGVMTLQAPQPVVSQAAPVKIKQYELVENKSYTDAAVLAVEILPDGSPGEPMFVIDNEKRFYGRVAVLEDSEVVENGYRGFALWATDNYESGVPGYAIIDQEGPAFLIAVALAESYNAGGTDCTLLSERISGSPDRGRLPVLDDDDRLEIEDYLSVASSAQPTQEWLAIFSETNEKYTFLVPLESTKHQLLRFETTAAKDWNAGTVAASLLSDADTTIAAITLYDRDPAKHECFVGSRGWCRYTGGHFDIVTMDSPARWGEGSLLTDWPLSSDNATVDLTTMLQWGASPNHLGHSGTITVYDTLPMRTATLLEGSKIRFLWDEKRKKFLLVSFSQKSGTVAWAKITGTIPAASSFPQPGVSSGEVCQIQKWSNVVPPSFLDDGEWPAMKGLNVTKTDLICSEDLPAYHLGTIQVFKSSVESDAEDVYYFCPSGPRDIRNLTGFDIEKKQIAWHDEGSANERLDAEECPDEEES